MTAPTMAVLLLAWFAAGFGATLLLGPHLRRAADLAGYLLEPAPGGPPPSRWGRSARLRWRAGTLGIGLLLGTTGMAAAGALPSPAQGMAHAVLGRVGVEVPKPPAVAPLRLAGPEQPGGEAPAATPPLGAADQPPAAPAPSGTRVSETSTGAGDEAGTSTTGTSTTGASGGSEGAGPSNGPRQGVSDGEPVSTTVTEPADDAELPDDDLVAAVGPGELPSEATDVAADDPADVPPGTVAPPLVTDPEVPVEPTAPPSTTTTTQASGEVLPPTTEPEAPPVTPTTEPPAPPAEG